MSQSADENKQRPLSLLNDFYIDFLGSLIPGLFAIVIGVAALSWSGSILCYSISSFSKSSLSQKDVVPTLEEQIIKWRDIGLGPYGNICLLLVASYVLGSIFYRQDPKKPDYKSARRIWRDPKLSKQDRDRLAVQPTSEHGTDVTEYDSQFPYFYLKEYLEGRGLNHLTRWVPWSGRNQETWKYRTKMFINLLKIRLQYLVPERCKDIIRNEAHVRMATSVWYASKFLIILTGTAFVMTCLTYLFAQNYSILSVMLFDLILFVFAFYIKFKIEWFAHYLRVREVVYVLETADFASRLGHQLYQEDFIKTAK
ncbi:MAG: hypothetical protein KJ826_19340 [Proteobacteria bacterium]|nr:hypothetical protein [Pseudomonadota bacterium]